MVLLLRVFLIGLAVYLIVRSFFLYGKETGGREKDNKSTGVSKKVSKDTGEYVDYEEIKD